MNNSKNPRNAGRKAKNRKRYDIRFADDVIDRLRTEAQRRTEEINKQITVNDVIDEVLCQHFGIERAS